MLVYQVHGTNLTYCRCARSLKGADQGERLTSGGEGRWGGIVHGDYRYQECPIKLQRARERKAII